ncbi:hypothetical protein FGO68_gene5479 [Halteria grandinella]|uniref:Uncharacterized protein n=1 Tax=Halteria grandinella TaxID=5974 RepID=A0A8J8NBU8_HALGN|nr:hypothetical protein FGO68_gene5479 [Halteria grandinella]
MKSLIAIASPCAQATQLLQSTLFTSGHRCARAWMISLPFDCVTTTHAFSHLRTSYHYSEHILKQFRQRLKRGDVFARWSSKTDQIQNSL